MRFPHISDNVGNCYLMYFTAHQPSSLLKVLWICLRSPLIVCPPSFIQQFSCVLLLISCFLLVIFCLFFILYCIILLPYCLLIPLFPPFALQLFSFSRPFLSVTSLSIIFCTSSCRFCKNIHTHFRITSHTVASQT